MPPVLLHVTDDGPPHGEPLVLLSSVGTAAPLWEPVLPALLGAGLRVVRLDARGHGRSPATPTVAGELRLEDLVEDVSAALDRLGLAAVHVAGASLGGMVGLALAARTPERVRSLVALCTSAHPGNPGAWEERARQVRAGGMAAVAGSVVGRWFTPTFAGANPATVAEHVRQLEQTDSETYAQLCADVLARLDLRPELALVTAPTLVVAGDRDPLFSAAHSRVIAEAVPGARMELLSPAAHLPVAERPGEVAALLVGHARAAGAGRAG